MTNNYRIVRHTIIKSEFQKFHQHDLKIEGNVQNRIVDCTVKATAGLPAVFSPGFGTTVRAGSR